MNITEESQRRLNAVLRYELGPEICAYLDDPNVIEIMCNPDGLLWVEKLGEDMVPFGTIPESQAMSMIGTVASSVNDVFNAENPVLECEFPLDGSRFAALAPPITIGPMFSIRKKAIKVFSLGDYVDRGIMTGKQRSEIEFAVRMRKNILIVGGTGSGKTTFANAVIEYISDICPNDRILIVEDTREIQCRAPNHASLRSTDKINIASLIKTTMRHRPTRILVGEVRDKAALELLKSWNTGHPGGIATVHGNSAQEGLSRMEQLILEVTESSMQSLIATSINLIVFIEKHEGTRKISELLRVTGWENGRYMTERAGN